MSSPATDQSPQADPRALQTTTEQEQVLSIQHWTDRYFSFRTTRNDGLRFENGQFVMVGLEIDGKLVRRAYSVASANWEEELEFFSIKVSDGKLTSQLQHIQVGDFVHVSRKPVGTLLLDDLHPGKTLWMLATGTGLAPFLALIKDPDVYERFDKIILVHGVRQHADLAYQDVIQRDLPHHPYLGDLIAEKLHYAPVVSREPSLLHGHMTDLLRTGELEKSFGVSTIDPANDRLMICGGTAMLGDLRELLDNRGFISAPVIGTPGDYVFERAFVSK